MDQRKSQRIGIDARFVGPQGTGLGKYTEKLINNLSLIDSKNQYFIFLRKNNWDYLKLGKNFKKILADIPWYSLTEQLKMPQIFASQNLDLLHIPHFNVPIFYRDKFIVTIHDLIHHQFSEGAATTRNPLIFRIKRLAYRLVITRTIQKSKKIITPSESIRREILAKFKIEPSKVVVTYEAAEEEYFKNSQFAIRNSQFPEREPFLIYVGNAYPHKNLERFLDALVILKNWKLEIGNWKLILVCPRDVFWKRLQTQIESRNLKKQVKMLTYQNPNQLAKLFSKASVYVFPSLAEGFGIPGLNAMAADLPVVCSNIPTLKEVYSQAALFFDPNDPQDIAAKIKQVLTNEKIRSDLIRKGKDQVKKYSWLNMAQETLRLYQSV